MFPKNKTSESGGPRSSIPPADQFPEATTDDGAKKFIPPAATPAGEVERHAAQSNPCQQSLHDSNDSNALIPQIYFRPAPPGIACFDDVKTKTTTAGVKDFDRPNGLCFSPDEKQLYVAIRGLADIKTMLRNLKQGQDAPSARKRVEPRRSTGQNQTQVQTGPSVCVAFQNL